MQTGTANYPTRAVADWLGTFTDVEASRDELANSLKDFVWLEVAPGKAKCEPLAAGLLDYAFDQVDWYDIADNMLDAS